MIDNLVEFWNLKLVRELSKIKKTKASHNNSDKIYQMEKRQASKYTKLNDNSPADISYPTTKY